MARWNILLAFAFVSQALHHVQAEIGKEPRSPLLTLTDIACMHACRFSFILLAATLSRKQAQAQVVLEPGETSVDADFRAIVLTMSMGLKHLFPTLDDLCG